MSSPSAVISLIILSVCVYVCVRVCVCGFVWQDLGGSGGPPRNWKGIGIAMVVILAVMSLVILSIIILTPGKTTQSPE